MDVNEAVWAEAVELATLNNYPSNINSYTITKAFALGPGAFGILHYDKTAYEYTTANGFGEVFSLDVAVYGIDTACSVNPWDDAALLFITAWGDENIRPFAYKKGTNSFRPLKMLSSKTYSLHQGGFVTT